MAGATIQLVMAAAINLAIKVAVGPLSPQNMQFAGGMRLTITGPVVAGEAK